MAMIEPITLGREPFARPDINSCQLSIGFHVVTAFTMAVHLVSDGGQRKR